MNHEWILQVLVDLHEYAVANGLEAIATMAAEGLQVARLELAGSATGQPPPDRGLH